MGSLFNSSSKTTTNTSEKRNQTSTTTPFSGDALTNYNNYLDTVKSNYANMNNNVNNLINSGKTAADTSKLDSVFGQYKNMDNSILNTLNTSPVNPNDNADWVNAQNTIDANARKGFGSTLNQVNQNIIGKGMANGSGHQSAAYNASATLNSALASDRAKRWTEQYNTNTQNALKANSQLSDFYNKLADIGVDYAKLSQQDFTTLLNAYNAQNDALKTYGNAITLGSNPTTTMNSESSGTNVSEKEDSPSIFNSLGNLASLAIASRGFGSKS